VIHAPWRKITATVRRANEEGAGKGADASLSTWGPLAVSVFRWLWIASVASNIGTWMQNVGASWLMTLLTPSPLLVALMQTASSLPLFLVGLPAGAIADVVDRRKLLLVTQGWMLAVATLLGALTLVNVMSAPVLLALTFFLGLGGALNAPAWQAIVPELVGRRMLAQAVALNSAGFNLARAVGPALGGLIVAAAGPGAVFLLNAASFLGVLVVIYLWKREPVENPSPPERVLGAIAAGTRYARHSFALRSVLIRTLTFIVAASALWALLPVVANHDLHLDAAGYGVLLGALGAGAVAAALMLQRLRASMSTDRLMVLATLGFGLATFALGYLHNLIALVVLLFVGGVSWMCVMSSLNVSAQNAAAAWVRARALGVYLLVFQGGMAAGSFGWGALAGRLGNSLTLGIAALVLGVSVVAAWFWPLHRVQSLDVSPSGHWPQPEFAVAPAPEDGPVLVTIEYRVPVDRAGDFAQIMQRVGRMRRRTGSYEWGLFNDPSDPERYIETFYTRTWAEHMRQHTRPTTTDRAVEEQAFALLKDGTAPVVSHFIASHPPVRPTFGRRG
jgi:MFS family permease